MPNRILNFNATFRLNFGIVLFLVCSIIYCAIPRQVFAHDGKGHIKDWNDVVGVQEESKETVQKCWDVFQEKIDDVERNSTFYKDFKKNFKEKYKIEIMREKECTHRTFFHWGYEAYDRNIEAIMEKCLYFKNNGETIKYVDFPKYVDSTQKGKDINKEIIDYLINATAKRNRKMIKAVKGTWFRRRKQASPFAGIIYDVHILGDWGDTATKPLLPPKELSKEINGYIEKFFKSPKGHQLGKEINKKIRHALSSENNDPDRAKEMLKILKSDFPTALSNEYGEELSKNGIEIRPKENSILPGYADRVVKKWLPMFGKNQ